MNKQELEKKQQDFMKKHKWKWAYRLIQGKKFRVKVHACTSKDNCMINDVHKSLVGTI